MGTLIEDDEPVVPRGERATATSHPDHTSDQSIRSRLLEFSSEKFLVQPWLQLRAPRNVLHSHRVAAPGGSAESMALQLSWALWVRHVDASPLSCPCPIFL